MLEEPITEEPNKSLDVEQDKMFTFQDARSILDRLIKDWKSEIDKTEERRKTRDVDINVQELRTRGKLDDDETIIPVRTIDTNIVREHPPYVNYLKNSRRLCTFNSLDNPDLNTQRLELDFTRGMSYTGWETPHFKNVDGALAHGYAAVEVVYDERKPLHVGVEYIAHEELFFPRTAKNIQDVPRLIRSFDVTISKLKDWVRNFDFDAEQVDKISRALKDTTKEAETIKVYKNFFKKEGIVYVSWFSLEHGVDNWLKAPAKAYLGINHIETRTEQQPSVQINPTTGMPEQIMIPTEINEWKDSDITLYPITLLPYRESENSKIVDYRGRIQLDEYKQEAQTAVLSGFINGLTRSSNVFASPAAEDGTGASLRQIEDIKLTGGRILSKPMNFWSPPYPDPMIIRAMEFMQNSNSQETNQVNFAAINREDSRKTAKEITSSEQTQSLLNSVQLTLFSTFIRSVYSFAWLIVQSQALQGKIKFLLIKKQKPVANPVNGQPVIDPMTGQPQMTEYYENDFDTISQTFELRAAGDVDVIQRQEKIQQMKQDWPVIMNTALKDVFLAELIKLEYPDTGERWAKILEDTSTLNTMQSVIARLSTIMQGFIEQHPEDAKNLPPEQQQALAQLLAEAQQFMPQQNNQPQTTNAKSS